MNTPSYNALLDRQKLIRTVQDLCQDIDKVASDSVTKEDLDTKQDTLYSGVNVKTINNQSILGNGNISISSSGTLVQEQVDWDESSSSAVTFIKNKPSNIVYWEEV